MKVINKPVEMISYSAADGDIKPIKFKIKINKEVLTVKVDRVFNQEKIKLSGKPVLCYTCISIIKGIEKLYELRFYPENIQRVIYKI